MRTSMDRSIMRRALSVAAVTTLAALPLVWASPSQAVTPTCFGKTVTVMGTAGDDELHGTPGTDVIYGGGGNDWIVGWSTANGNADPDGTGPDYLCGGPGGDILYGNGGADHLNGGDGNDGLNGGPGSDVIQGNSGGDFLEAEYNDSDAAPNDVLRGGPGPDDLQSGYGPDRLYGNSGKDFIFDGDCFTKDSMYGGHGSDTLKSFRWYAGGINCADMSGAVSDYLDGGTEYDYSITDGIDFIVNVEDQSVFHD
jgi:Ca2+-binding RTX toxin-like protein